MAQMTCSECGQEIVDAAWNCPRCGVTSASAAAAENEKAISVKGMACLLLVFVLFPVLLFLIHIFVPNM